MRKFVDSLNELIGERGLVPVANGMGVDSAILCKFRSNQGNISLSAIEKFLELKNSSIVANEEWNRLQDAVETITML